MTNHSFSNQSSQQSAVPEIEEIEAQLQTYRPNPGSGLQDKVANTLWMNQSSSLNRHKNSHFMAGFHQKQITRWALAFLSVLFVVLLLTFTNIGQIVASSVSRFFKIAPSNYQTQIVDTTPMSTLEPGFQYKGYTLNIEQAEALSGLQIKSLAVLPTKDWVFRGAENKPEKQGVSLLYGLPSKKPDVYRQDDILVYIFEQKGDFEDFMWGECTDGAVKEVKINNWPGELDNGSTWQTHTEPTPGVKQEWFCVIQSEVVMTLRWEETDIKYEISVQQLGLNGEGADMTIPWLTEQDLINLAESLK